VVLESAGMQKHEMTVPACEHGTFVITMPCRDGLVVCADKRVTTIERVVSDNEVKITQLGRNAAFTATGLHRAESIDVRVPDFQVFHSIEQETADINLNYLNGHIPKLAERLAARLEATLRTTSHPGVMPQQENCQVLIWHLDAVRNMHGARIELDYDDTRPVKGRWRVFNITDHMLAEPLLSGNCDPFLALRSTDRLDFLMLRDDKQFQNFEALTKQRRWKELSPMEAAQIGQYVIFAASEVQRIDGMKVPSISAGCDCALLSPRDGFLWLHHRDRDASQ
jgi:hypothetical protein